jgi:hypothetical protein
MVNPDAGIFVPTYKRHTFLDPPLLIGVLKVKQDRLGKLRGFYVGQAAPGIVALVLRHPDSHLDLQPADRNHISILQSNQVDVLLVAACAVSRMQVFQ